jgi:hypothetical protein
VILQLLPAAATQMTSVKSGNRSPNWNEGFTFRPRNPAKQTLKVTMRSEGETGNSDLDVRNCRFPNFRVLNSWMNIRAF